MTGARKLHEEVLAIRRRVLGPEHPDTLLSMSHLASNSLSQGDLANARKLGEEALTIQPKHSALLTLIPLAAAWNLFRTLQDLGENAAAKDVLERDLRWLLDRDPATLGAEQRKDRENVALVAGKVDSG